MSMVFCETIKTSDSEKSKAPTKSQIFLSMCFWNNLLHLKNMVMLSCLVLEIRFPHFHVYGLLWSAKTSGSETSKAPTQGPENFKNEFLGQYTPCENIVMFSRWVWEIPPPLFMYMVLYDAKRHRVRWHWRPLPRVWKFQGGVFGTIYAPCIILPQVRPIN